jgi:hypothetical protein
MPERVRVHPAYARLSDMGAMVRRWLMTQDGFPACAVRFLARKGWRLLAYSLMFDGLLCALLAAVAERRDGVFIFSLLLLWGMRGLFFIKSAAYDLVRFFLKGHQEAQTARFAALLDEADFPPNSAGLSLRAYLRAVIDFKAAPQPLRLAAGAIDAGFTAGFSRDGMVQEYLATRAFGRALTHYARRRGGK